jgi:hypothetical protein
MAAAAPGSALNSAASRLSNLGYLFPKHLTTKIKILSLLNTQLNATMPQVGMKDLLHASILSFDYFKIYE